MSGTNYVTDVQALWKTIYNLPSFPSDGSQWDRLFKDGDRFRIGELEARVMFFKFPLDAFASAAWE